MVKIDIGTYFLRELVLNGMGIGNSVIGSSLLYNVISLTVHHLKTLINLIKLVKLKGILVTFLS